MDRPLAPPTPIITLENMLPSVGQSQANARLRAVEVRQRLSTSTNHIPHRSSQLWFGAATYRESEAYLQVDESALLERLRIIEEFLRLSFVTHKVGTLRNSCTG